MYSIVRFNTILCINFHCYHTPPYRAIMGHILLICLVMKKIESSDAISAMKKPKFFCSENFGLFIAENASP